jgi:alkylation response protein AidB-like acyl-CoA dehydrogenase
MITETRTTTPQDVVRAVHDLAPTISARAAEVEAARRIPADLLESLVDAGCFRLLMPESHGGTGADLVTAMAVLDGLARADGSVAWTVMIGGASFCDLAGLPRATFDAIFAHPDVIVAGAFAPSGSATPINGGYRVSGRWGFASGCEHADVVYANCVEAVVDGVPHLRMAVLTPDQITIEDTWNVLGLRGTGSHHFRADAVLPADRTLRPLLEEPCLDEPIVRVPIPTLYALCIAAVAVGIARGALDNVLGLAASKVPLLAGAPLAADPLFQSDLAAADTELRAARALLHEAAGSAWAGAVESTPFPLEQVAHLRAAAVWATDRAAAAVGTAYRAGGGTSIYADSPLQRRLRDVQTLTQHFLVKPATLATAGAVLAGQEITVPVF